MTLPFFGALWSHPAGRLIVVAVTLISVTAIIRSRSKAPAHAVVAVLYSLAVVVIADRIAVRAARNPYLNGAITKVSYVASRRLPANTRLTRTAWRRPADVPPGYFWFVPDAGRLEGKYLPNAVNAGETIDVDALLVVPRLPDGTILLPIGKPGGTQLFNAGAKVDLCAADGDCVTAITVAATVCDTDTCYAALEPRPEQRKALTPKHQTMKLISLE